MKLYRKNLLVCNRKKSGSVFTGFFSGSDARVKKTSGNVLFSLGVEGCQ